MTNFDTRHGPTGNHPVGSTLTGMTEPPVHTNGHRLPVAAYPMPTTSRPVAMTDTDHPVPTTPDRRTRRLAYREQKATARRTRRLQRRADRAARWSALRTVAAKLRPVAPLLVVNATAVYGQVAFAYDNIAPTKWDVAARLLLACGFAAAVESVALYVGWHAHDALLKKAYANARRLRAGSYLLAAFVGAINYAHFAGEGMAPTSAAVAFGLLSLISPWLWGLHTRREQHIQLLTETEVDRAGVEFDPKRRRKFPIRTWRADRWAVLHNVTDPAAAWEGYLREEAARRAGREERAAARAVEARRREIAGHALKVAQTAAEKGQSGESLRALREYVRTLTGADHLSPVKATAHLPVGADHLPTTMPTGAPTTMPTTKAIESRPVGTRKATRSAPTTPARKWPPVAIRDAAQLREIYGTVGADHLPGRNELARQNEWNGDKASKARAAYLAGADLAPKEG